MATLEDAIALAVKSHAGQYDKAGKPYILHPLRVMLGQLNEEDMMAGVLHDVVEDTPVTLEDLQAAGYSLEVVAAVDSLTRRDDESYEDYLVRCRANPIALRVKLADLQDNMDIRRIQDLRDKDLSRLQKYIKAWHFLTSPS